MCQHKKPICCPLEAFEMMREAVATIDTDDGLLVGLCAIDRMTNELVHPPTVKGEIEAIAMTVVARLQSSSIHAMLAHLHQVLFDEMKFSGNTTQYHAVENSHITSVLTSKRGLPITLSAVYALVGRQLGMVVHGLGLPGHFCVGVEVDGKVMIVNPFDDGGVLNRKEALAWVRNTHGAQEWSDEWMQPVTHRHWLTRVMQNLLHSYSECDKLGCMAGLLELQMVLWPEQTHLVRDLGLVLGRLGNAVQAAGLIRRYLSLCPQDPQREELMELVRVME